MTYVTSFVNKKKILRKSTITLKLPEVRSKFKTKFYFIFLSKL